MSIAEIQGAVRIDPPFSAADFAPGDPFRALTRFRPRGVIQRFAGDDKMTMTSGLGRAAAFGAMLGMLSLGCAASAAYAQAVVLPDGKFASKRDYLYGTWVWERQSPRQTVQMRFSRKGDFFFHNLTSGLSHSGRFESRAKRLYLVIRRTCTNNGKKCANRNPPRKVDYDFRPVRADQFISSDEDWRRKSRE